MNAFLEALAYAIVRGAVRAYLDVLNQRSTATEEVTNDDDKKRASHFRNAVNVGLFISSEKSSIAGPKDTAQTGVTGSR